jgi:hypothetical protein
MNHLVPGAGWEEYGPAFGGHDFVKQLNLVSITCSNEAETIQRGGDHEDIRPHSDLDLAKGDSFHLSAGHGMR